MKYNWRPMNVLALHCRKPDDWKEGRKMLCPSPLSALAQKCKDTANQKLEQPLYSYNDAFNKCYSRLFHLYPILTRFKSKNINRYIWNSFYKLPKSFILLYCLVLNMLSIVSLHIFILWLHVYLFQSNVSWCGVFKKIYLNTSLDYEPFLNLFFYLPLSSIVIHIGTYDSLFILIALHI